MLIKRVVAKAGDSVEVLSFTFKMICNPYRIVGRAKSLQFFYQGCCHLLCNIFYYENFTSHLGFPITNTILLLENICENLSLIACVLMSSVRLFMLLGFHKLHVVS